MTSILVRQYRCSDYYRALSDLCTCEPSHKFCNTMIHEIQGNSKQNQGKTILCFNVCVKHWKMFRKKVKIAAGELKTSNGASSSILEYETKFWNWNNLQAKSRKQDSSWVTYPSLRSSRNDLANENASLSHMVASTSGSVSTATVGELFPPLRREDTLSIAEFSWLIFSFKVCLVLCFPQNVNTRVKWSEVSCRKKTTNNMHGMASIILAYF